MSFELAAAAAGTALSMAASFAQGRAQAGAAKAESKQLKQAADRQRISAQEEENVRRDEILRLEAANIVDASARGQDAYSGSTANVIARAKSMGEEETRQQRRADEAEARRLEYGAALKKAQARQTMTGTFMRMGSQLVSGGARMYSAGATG